MQTIWKFLRLSRGGRWKDVEKERAKTLSLELSMHVQEWRSPWGRQVAAWQKGIFRKEIEGGRTFLSNKREAG